MQPEQAINVHIGEVKLGHPDCELKTILGSCVGIALFWKNKNKMALAHCLLPLGHSASHPGKFVNQAIETLCHILHATSADYKYLEAIVVGGAKITTYIQSPLLNIGEMNIIAALRGLSERKINIVFQDIGDHYGRHLKIDCNTYEYQVRNLQGSTHD